MRFVFIGLVLLLAADAQAKEAAEIYTPKVDGVAHGTSTYKTADGTRIEILWSKGRKHGPYRHIHPNGVVLEEGQYEHGQRSGSWIRRGVDGNTTGAGSYVLGLHHGLHQRHEYVGGRATLVESINYVLGVRHGAAVIRESTGELVSGSFLRGVRHGAFASLDLKDEKRVLYFCGRKNPVEGKLPTQGHCDERHRFDLHDPGGLLRDRKVSKRAMRLTKLLCEGSSALQATVLVEGHALPCGRAEPREQGVRLATAIVGVYSADDIARAVDEQFGRYLTVSGTFYQARFNSNDKLTFRSAGLFKVFLDRRSEWRFINRGCNVLVDPVAKVVSAATKAKDMKATKPLGASALRFLAQFADTKKNLLDDHTATATATSQGMEILLRLTPRIPQTDVTSVQIHLGLTDYGTLIVENVALDLKGGGKLTTRFRNLFGKAAVDFDPYRLENPKPMASEWSKVKDVKVKDLPCQGQAW